jgi:hypothetical protein
MLARTQHAHWWPRLLLIVIFIAIAAMARLLPHPPNVSPIGALALFAGACLPRCWFIYLIPLVAMFLGDLVLGLHSLIPVVYGSFAVNVLLGRWLRTRRTMFSTATITLIGSIQFFVVTNLACWFLYDPPTLEGLLACYVHALPFFRNALLGDLFFTTVLFGALALLERWVPLFRERPVTLQTY